MTQREAAIESPPGQEDEEQETLNSLELAIENGRRYKLGDGWWLSAYEY